jgi:hypothetical protein
MTSLLPSPLGAGARKASKLRKYVMKWIADVEYRTLSCRSRDEAKSIEKQLLAAGGYLFR